MSIDYEAFLKRYVRHKNFRKNKSGLVFANFVYNRTATAHRSLDLLYNGMEFFEKFSKKFYKEAAQ